MLSTRFVLTSGNNFNRLTKVPLFPINGELLKKKGMKEGQSLGNVLKILEKEWVTNNFKISNERIDEIIQINLN